MKANEYVKLVGWEYAKLNASSCSHQYYFLHNGYAEVCVSELKRLVESYELVESKGGIELSKKEVRQRSIVRWVDPEVERLREAIADVESCQ